MSECVKALLFAYAETSPPAGKSATDAAGANIPCTPANDNAAVTKKSQGRETERQHATLASNAKINGRKTSVMSSGSLTIKL
jgi:hypothetical protein